jgi:hypothetical protein
MCMNTHMRKYFKSGRYSTKSSKIPKDFLNSACSMNFFSQAVNIGTLTSCI